MKSQLLIFTLAFLLLYTTSCSKKTPTTTGVDFTLDLTQPANAALKKTSGSLISHEVLIMHFANNYFATASVCSYGTCTLAFNDTTAQITCKCHGCLFDINGVVKKAPATVNIKRYNAVLIGNDLSITGS
jgi:Rieske Fe-S protein